MKTYLNLVIGAARRLRNLRAAAMAHNEKYAKHGTVKTWRDMRYADFETVDPGLNQSYTKGGQSWYTRGGAQFERELYADECGDAPRDVANHTGWFCDEYCENKARGVVVALPHGRFIAGYELSVNDERVYFGNIYTEEREAARAADSHAETIAEQEKEHDERFRAAQRLQDETEDKETRLRECLALRNNKCFQALRDEARELVETIRVARETLRTDYAGLV